MNGYTTALLTGAMALLLAGPACAHSRCPEEVRMEQLAPMDAPLRQMITEHPDSVVGVLLRTREPPAEQERRELERAGLQIGTVVGDIVTGRLRACNALRVAELSFVRYIELARPVTIPPPVSPE